MKKIIILMSLCLLIATHIQAQRYLPGQKGLQITVGAVDGFTLEKKDKQAFAANIAWSSYTQNGNRWLLGAGYLQKSYEYEKELIPVSQFTAEAGYYINFLSDRRKIFFLSLGLSAMTGYETINWGKELLWDGATIQSKDNLLYGGAVTLETEAFISDNFAFLIHVRERMLMGSDINKFHLEYGLGVKFIIN